MLKLKADIVNAFVEPCLHIFEEIVPKAGVLEINDVYARKMKVSNMAVSVICMISGDLVGKIVLSLNSETAMEIAEQMTDEIVDSLNADAQSAITELMTMIVGNSSMALSDLDHEIKMSPATLTYTNSERIGSEDCPFPLTIEIKSEIGVIELDLAFHETA